MSTDITKQQFLDEFARSVDMDQIQLNEEGFAALEIEDDLIIELQYIDDSEVVLLFSDLGSPEDGEKWYESLLQANLFWQSTGGATLSLTDDLPPRVIMAQSYSLKAILHGEFADAFHHFVGCVEDWRELLASGGAQSVASDDEWDAMQGEIVRA